MYIKLLHELHLKHHQHHHPHPHLHHPHHQTCNSNFTKSFASLLFTYHLLCHKVLIVRRALYIIHPKMPYDKGSPSRLPYICIGNDPPRMRPIERPNDPRLCCPPPQVLEPREVTQGVSFGKETRVDDVCMGSMYGVLPI